MSSNLHTSRSRDAALRRLRRANRWLIAGSATLTGVLTAVAASAFPGKTLKDIRATAHHDGHRSTRTAGASSSSSASTLKAPSRAPQSSSGEESSSSPDSSAGGESSSASPESSPSSSTGTESSVPQASSAPDGKPKLR